MDNLLLLFLAVFLLILDWFCISARTSFQLASHVRLLSYRESDEKRASRALSLFSDIKRVRAALNLALVLVRFFLVGLLVVFLFSTLAELPPWLLFLILLAGAVILFWFEWLAEAVISKKPEFWALRLALFTRFIQVLFAWGTFLPLLSSGAARKPTEVVSTVTENDLKTLVDTGQEEGVFEKQESRMIFSIFQLGETLVREIMVPRLDIFALEANTPLGEAVQLVLQSGHSRIPIYRETIDQVLGVIYVKDLLQAVHAGNLQVSLETLKRDAYFVPEAKHVDELLAEMQAQRIHMAIVVDEYGGVAGLVTLEDIVEEIVGEIQDEYDQGEESPFQAVAEGEFLFQARIDLDDFNEVMGSSLSKEEADSLGGFIYSRLGRVPTVGETIQEGDISLTVEQVSARRIRKVRARRVPVLKPSEAHPTREGEAFYD